MIASLAFSGAGGYLDWVGGLCYSTGCAVGFWTTSSCFEAVGFALDLLIGSFYGVGTGLG